MAAYPKPPRVGRISLLPREISIQEQVRDCIGKRVMIRLPFRPMLYGKVLKIKKDEVVFLADNTNPSRTNSKPGKFEITMRHIISIEPLVMISPNDFLTDVMSETPLRASSYKGGMRLWKFLQKSLRSFGAGLRSTVKSVFSKR